MAKKSRKSALDTEIQSLYALPLGEFTGARNALAARLRKAGDAAGSDEVKSLSKPTPSAWAVNVLLRREPEKMEALLEAGEQARTAQRKAVTGGGAETLRESLQAERDLRDELRRRAAALLEEDGRKASQAMLDRVAANLDAIALSPDAAEAAERGWIHQDLDPPGFEVFAGLQLTARPRHLKLVPPPAARPERRVNAPEEAPKRDRQASKAEQARKRQEEAERARREREEAKQSERRTRLGARLTESQAEADTARREVERLEKALADAERAAEEARRRVESLREDAGRARQRADRAAGKLARARKDFDAVR